MAAKVIVILSDGERASIGDDELALVFDALWARAKDTTGAVSAAGMIDYARRASRHLGLTREVVLTERQSEVFREALAHVRESDIPRQDD
jgi:hypothetical protein